MCNTDNLFRKALNMESLTVAEGLHLYRKASLPELMELGMELRKKHVPGNNIGWMIDRNINITNICFSQCLFCNFCRRITDPDAYITTMAEYREKIRVLFEMGGNQVLLQGGMHPRLGLDFYVSLFRSLKDEFPALKLHALGPPEIVWIARKEKMPVKGVLESLIAAGLDSLPGAGAEILSDRVRNIISPAKATASEWLDVMRHAHLLNLPTSATMMFGHIETDMERIEHLVLLRTLQDEKPAGHHGFITFIPWPVKGHTALVQQETGTNGNSATEEYLRLIAISRIMLNNITNIQSSLLTVGAETAALTLHAGANDLGSVMIEENVVSAAGGGHMFSAAAIREIISREGFTPVQRDQKYNPV